MNNKGQLTVEAVLLLTLFVALMMAGSTAIRSQGYLSRLVQGPWIYLSGMMENGIWAPPQAGRSLHPNQLQRRASPEGDSI